MDRNVCQFFNFPIFHFLLIKTFKFKTFLISWCFKKQLKKDERKYNYVYNCCSWDEENKRLLPFLRTLQNIRKCNGSRKSLRMKIMNIWWKSHASLQWCTLNQCKIHGNCTSFPLDISYRHFRIVFYAFLKLPIA